MVDVILPVLDEAEAIAGVLAGLPPGFRAIVVDNGSTDGSGAVAERAGAVVVREPRRGFGAACWAGLSAARSDVVCFMDCDGSFDGRDLELVAGPVSDGDADLALGARMGAAGPVHARLANRAIAGLLRRRYGIPISDLGPMRAARRDALLELGLVDRGFGWPLEMIMRASQAGWRIAEVDVSYGARVGRSKVTGTARGSLRAARDMSKVAATLARAKA